MTPREQELIERAFAEGLLSQAEVQAAQGLAAQGLAGGLLAALSARLEPARRAQLSAMWEALRVLGPWQLGARLPDGLELVEKLGAGGMGEVFLARGPNGERCAVKALDRDAHPVLAERFTREGAQPRRVARRRRPSCRAGSA